MQYKVERDVAIPEKKTHGHIRNDWLKDMEVGSSIVVDLPQKSIRRKEVSRIKSLMRHRKWKSIQRNVSHTAVRIWRTA